MCFRASCRVRCQRSTSILVCVSVSVSVCTCLRSLLLLSSGQLLPDSLPANSRPQRRRQQLQIHRYHRLLASTPTSTACSGSSRSHVCLAANSASRHAAGTKPPSAPSAHPHPQRASRPASNPLVAQHARTGDRRRRAEQQRAHFLHRPGTLFHLASSPTPLHPPPPPPHHPPSPLPTVASAPPRPRCHLLTSPVLLRWVPCESLPRSAHSESDVSTPRPASHRSLLHRPATNPGPLPANLSASSRPLHPRD